MAAVVFRALGQACEAVGQLLCLPCRACGMGCDFAGAVCKSPFFPYLAVTFLLNLPPVVKTGKIIPDLFFDGSITDWCSKGANWLVLNMALCLVHMAAALYLVHRIRTETAHHEDEDDEEEDEEVAAVAVVTGVDNNSSKIKEGTYYAANATTTPTPQATVPPASPGNWTTTSVESSEPMTMERIKQVLCEDPGIAIYLLICILWVVWQCLGLSRYAQIGEECGDTKSVMGLSLTCGWVYSSLVGFAFCASMCCL